MTLSSEGTEETTTTKVYVPRKSEPDDKRKTIPTKLGRGIVGTAYNGRRWLALRKLCSRQRPDHSTSAMSRS